MHIETNSYFGNPNVGMHVFANDKLAIVGNNLSDEHIQQIKDILKVPVFKTNVCGTTLPGIFIAGDNNAILVPDIVLENEREVLESLPMKVIFVPTKNTALGNSVCLKDNILITHDEFEEEAIKHIQKEIESLQIHRISVGDTTVIGSCLCLTPKGGVIHPEVDDDTLQELQDLLNVKITRGTVNQGSPYVRSGICANSNGFIIGNTSAGPEITNVDEALGFLQIDN